MIETQNSKTIIHFSFHPTLISYRNFYVRQRQTNETRLNHLCKLFSQSSTILKVFYSWSIAFATGISTRKTLRHIFGNVICTKAVIKPVSFRKNSGLGFIKNSFENTNQCSSWQDKRQDPREWQFDDMQTFHLYLYFDLS